MLDLILLFIAGLVIIGGTVLTAESFIDMSKKKHWWSFAAGVLWTIAIGWIVIFWLSTQTEPSDLLDKLFTITMAVSFNCTGVLTFARWAKHSADSEEAFKKLPPRMGM